MGRAPLEMARKYAVFLRQNTKLFNLIGRYSEIKTIRQEKRSISYGVQASKKR